MTEKVALPSYWLWFSSATGVVAASCAVLVVVLAIQLEAGMRRDELVALERAVRAMPLTKIDELERVQSGMTSDRHSVRLEWLGGGSAHDWHVDERGLERVCLPLKSLGQGGCLLMEVRWTPGPAMLGQGVVRPMFAVWILLILGFASVFHVVAGRRFHAPFTAVARRFEQEAAKLRSLDMIIHDLRKPMRAIRESLGEASTKIEGRTTQDVIREICGSVDEIIGDVDEMLRSAGTSHSGYAVAAEQFSVEDLILDSLRQCAGLLHKSDCGLSYRFSHVRMLEGDRGLLGRMVANLLGNALEAVEDGGEVWFASDEVHQETRPQLKMTVGNSGSYIAEEDQVRIFSPFFTKGKSNGTGLGLAFVRLVVETHGGRVSVRSSKEGGTEFTVTLPLAVEVLSRSTTTLPTSAKEAAAKFIGVEGAADAIDHLDTILVVDDDVFVREAWELGCRDANVVTMGCPEEVLGRLGSDPNYLKRFAAVITDYYFGVAGGLNGVEFAARVRKTFAGAIILSSSTTLANLDDASDVDLQIAKDPVPWRTLSDRVMANVKSVNKSNPGKVS